MFYHYNVKLKNIYIYKKKIYILHLKEKFNKWFHCLIYNNKKLSNNKKVSELPYK